MRDVLSSSLLPDGRLGAFHPDNFTFGQPVYASRIVAAAQAVEGVESVRLDRFERLADPDPATLEQGVIPIGRLEIAQLANDPNYRDRGRLRLSAGRWPVSAPQPEPPRLPAIPPGTESLRLLRGRRSRHAAGRRQSRAASPPSATASAPGPTFARACTPGCRRSRLAALRGLTTRDDDDFSIGLLDAFACAADVLTFYQERIANESYLGTARERVSLQEMGRLIGYRLRPGVAAETSLAFTLETPPVPPAAAQARARHVRHRVPGEDHHRRRESRCAACPRPARCRRYSRPSKPSMRVPTGTRCGPG